VLITQVTPASPAEKAGLKQGDVIVKLNGEAVTDIPPFRNKLSMMQPGTVVKLDIIRDGAPKAVSVKIEKLPAKEEGQTASTQAPGAAETVKKLGLTVTTLTGELKEKHNLKDDKGALVTAVDPDSTAAAAGIRPGMLIVEIDRKAIANAKDFEKAFVNRPDRPLLLLVKDGQGSRYMAIDTKK
jgi:serine protease Do